MGSEDRGNSVAQRLIMVVGIDGLHELKRTDFDSALERLREQHQEIAALLRARESADGTCGYVAKFLGEGVVASCEPTRVDDVLAVAWQVIYEAERAAEDRTSLALRRKIALTAGKVEMVQYSATDPTDVQGLPVDTALRLVSEVAKPGQILLDPSVRQNATLEAVQARVAGVAPDVSVALKPLDGIAKDLYGLPGDVSVCQLVWRDEHPITNQRVLSEETLALQAAALRVMTRINQFNRHYRAAVYSRSPSEEQIDNLLAEVDSLTADDGELTALNDFWGSSAEAQYERKLEKPVNGLTNAHSGLRQAFADVQEAFGNTTSDVRKAIIALRDRWSEFQNAGVRLVNKTQELIEMLRHSYG